MVIGPYLLQILYGCGERIERKYALEAWNSHWCDFGNHSLFVFGQSVQWILNLTKRVDLFNPIATGETLVEEYHCRSCHEINGIGGVIGPSLSHAIERYDDETIEQWLRNPLQLEDDTRMPTFFLSEFEIDAIVLICTILLIRKSHSPVIPWMLIKWKILKKN